MRPRSWCSWARPKRSACSTTMTEAAGTSTPTSITVVATSRSSPPSAKAGHGGVALGGLHAAMDQADPRAEAFLQLGEALLGGRQIHQIGFPHQRADPEDPRAAVDRAAHRGDDLVEALQRQGPGIDGLAARRLLGEARDVEIAIDRHHQGARDRRGGHGQQMRLACPCRPGPGAARRRSDAARRRRRGRDP